MKYERLTPRMLLSDAIKEYYQPKKMWRTFKYGKHDMLDLIDRLVELENKIERGELVEVPKGAVVLTPEEREEEMRLCNDELVGEVYCVRHGKRLEQIEEEKGE